MALDQHGNRFFDKSRRSFVQPCWNWCHLHETSLLSRCPRTNALKQIECLLDFALACLVAVSSRAEAFLAALLAASAASTWYSRSVKMAVINQLTSRRLSHVTVALSCALHVIVHVPLSTRRWLPNKPRAIVALDGSASDLVPSHPQRHMDVPILHHPGRVCRVPAHSHTGRPPALHSGSRSSCDTRQGRLARQSAAVYRKLLR